jgi:hypothetical protein
MKKTLNFSVSIRAPRRIVWDTMLGADGYKAWTSAFCEGSHFVGSWDEGSKIQFLAPSGDGMTAVIAESKPYEHVSIRHLGEVSQGVEDTTSDKVRAWAPAYENYTLADAAGATTLTVSLETVPAYEQYMLDTFPKALDLLRDLCERAAKAGADARA